MVFGNKEIKPFRFNDMLVFDGVNIQDTIDDGDVGEEEVSGKDEKVGNGECDSEKMELMTKNGNRTPREEPIKM